METANDWMNLLNSSLKNGQKLLGYSELGKDTSNDIGVCKSAMPDNQNISVNNKKAKIKIITGLELLNMKIKHIPTLVDPIIPKIGVLSLIGTSDIGKSTLLLQLCTDVVLNNEFLGFEINALHRSTIYVSTEDDEFAISKRLQHLQGCDQNRIENMRFLFNSDNLVQNLDAALQDKKADLVVVDTFTDIFTGEMNQINKVRSFMNDYHNLAIKHKCAIIFNHHTGKGKEEKEPSKNNSIGSAGFEGKSRMVMELRADPKDNANRHLCIVKGNYLGTEYKNSSFELDFDPQKGFSRTGKRTPFNELIRPKLFKPIANREEEKKLVCEFFGKGHSSREIEKILRKLGYSVGKTTIAEWMKDCPSNSNLRKLADTGH